MHDLVAAGIEAGSKSTIEREWALQDVDAQRRAWRRNGPPLNIAAVAIAMSLGVDLLKQRDADDCVATAPIADNRPTLADLSTAVPMPVPGGDTLAASAAILAKLKGLT